MTVYTIPSGQRGTHSLMSGDSEDVLSGGTAVDTTVFGGASLNVSGGGSATGTDFSGGQENLQGTDSGATGANAFQNVFNGGMAVDADLTGFSFQLIGAGSVADGATLAGSAVTPTFTDLTTQEIDTGGIASDTLLAGDTVENIFGGVAINTSATGGGNNINDRGVLLYSGTNAQVSAAIFDNGIVDVEGDSTRVDITGANSFYGPFTGEAVVGAGAELELGQSDALGSGTVIFGQGEDGTLTIDGFTTPTEEIAGFFAGDTIIIAGATSSDSVVGTGFVALYTSGGEDDISIANAVPGGIGVENSNGNIIITSFEQPNLVVGNGDSSDLFDTVSSYLVNDGGTLTVEDDASALGGIIGAAVLAVTSGGLASGNFLQSGSVEDLQDGGQSTNDQIYYGAEQMVETGATSDDPVVNGGSVIDDGSVDFDGNVPGTGSGQLDTLTGTGAVDITGGAVQQTGDASGFTGTVMLMGQATYELFDNADLNSAASIDFDGGTADPTLQIDATLSNLPQATISAFATPLDIIDLRSFAYVSNTTSTPYTGYNQASIVTSGGTTSLEVISAATVYTLTLDPATATTGPVDFYNDGSGGTDISPSTLSASDANTLEAAIGSTAALSSGTYTIFLTDDVITTSAGGETATLDPIQAQNGTTIVLNGEGFGLFFAADGDSSIVAGGGPIVVTSLGGDVDFQITDGSHLAAVSDTFDGGVIITSGTLEVATAGGAGPASIVFDPQGGSETLQVDAAAMPANGGIFSNALNDFSAAPTQYIDLAGLTFSSAMTSATEQDGTLQVTNGASSIGFTLGGDDSPTFNTFDDGRGGTLVTADSTACYATGTLILTEAGEVPVEALAAGDTIVTASGAPRPIRWIGRRSYGGRFLAGRRSMLPIRIQAGALAHGIPARDLFVSPKHAMFLDGILVPAEALVNGSSITQATAIDKVTYWHIELDSHDIILAEGAPSESFLDEDSRAMFDNAAEGQPSRHPPQSCAPRIEQGFQLEIIRQRIARRIQQAA